jgi:hypothetical protein
MPGRKMDPMRAKALASRLRNQYPGASTGQLKGMLETGQPMGEDPMKLRGMSSTGYQGTETGPAYRPISELSEMELNQLGITRKDPMEPMRRMESSAAYGESDSMTGMTETEAFPESRQPSYMDRLNAKSRSMMGTGPSYTDTMRDMMDTADVPAMARGDFMEELTQSTDYGNAYADTISTRKPETFEGVDDLADVPMMYDTSIEKAFSIYNRTGRVPPTVAVEIGRLAGLMDVKRSMEDMDSESLRRSMLKERRDYIQDKEIQPAIDDFGDSRGR